MDKRQRIMVLGLGGLARSVVDIADDSRKFEVIGFVVNEPPFSRGTTVAGKRVYWIDEIFDMDKNFSAICPLESIRKINFINEILSFDIQMATLIHPSAYVSRTAEIGKDVIINSGTQIATNSQIKDHVIINRGALIGHDVTINELCYISPGVNIASDVTIGSKTKIGMGANIIENIQVGENCIIGAGSLLTRDVPDGVKVVGMPARIIEKNIEAS